MFDRITYISDHSANIKLKEGNNAVINLMNMHIVFEDNTKTVLGEVDDMDGDVVKARFLGEIANGRLISGTIRKPSLDAKIRVIRPDEVPMITGTDTTGFMKLGVSPFYNDFPVFLDVNNFFSNHFAIFGNTGSGKSCGVSRVFQNMFHDERLYPYKANILIFDSSGEYYNAFRNLNEINPNYNYRFYSTNENDGIGEKLRLPIYLLNKDDLALLLQCTSHSQLPIIERMLKLALVFSQNDMDANAYKNHLIAKAIMTILYTNETAPNKRNEIFSILASCSTQQFNLEAPVQGIGYVRKFRECFLIDNSGNFSESVLLTEYVSSFIKEEYESYEPHGGVFYNLDTLEKALNFTLISEGWLRNEQTYGDAVTVRVRLHSLIVGKNAKYFDVSEYITLETYLSSMLINNGRKYQIVNINLDDVDDEFAKVMTKVYSRLVFDFAKGLKARGSIPFHIILEEAHRYIQNDRDRFLFGYNVFERIAKEGRKYGVVLGLISQRPVEISDTVISQCTNFLIFKINHPMDVEYMRKMVPNITDEIVEKQKSLQSGTCLGFGLAFKIPLIVKLEMPNPSPLSSNCDVVNIWSGHSSGSRNNVVPVVEKPLPNNVGNPVSFNMNANFLGDSAPEKFDDSFIIPSEISEGNAVNNSFESNNNSFGSNEENNSSFNNNFNSNINNSINNDSNNIFSGVVNNNGNSINSNTTNVSELEDNTNIPVVNFNDGAPSTSSFVIPKINPMNNNNKDNNLDLGNSNSDNNNNSNSNDNISGNMIDNNVNNNNSNINSNINNDLFVPDFGNNNSNDGQKTDNGIPLVTFTEEDKTMPSLEKTAELPKMDSIPSINSNDLVLDDDDDDDFGPDFS